MMASSAPLDWSKRENPKTIVLFDVDGTLTAARKTIESDMKKALGKLRQKVVIGFVGGSDLKKQVEQLGDHVLDEFDFCFSENGLTAFKLGKPLPSESFIDYVGEEQYQGLVGFILRYIADLKLPRKRGTFIEFRKGMINVSPIGRNCTYEERNEYEKFDLEHHVRATFVQKLKENFGHLNLTYSIGGQISFDVFPTGWDKTYCLRHLKGESFDKIYFFGDKTSPGGNDYEIYTHPSVKGFSVKTPADTLRILEEEFHLSK